jgi:hypothetical protein
MAVHNQDVSTLLCNIYLREVHKVDASFVGQIRNSNQPSVVCSCSGFDLQCNLHAVCRLRCDFQWFGRDIGPEASNLQILCAQGRYEYYKPISQRI